MGSKLKQHDPKYLERLVEFADSVVGRPFAWGATDCVTLAARCLEIQFPVFDASKIVTWRSLADARRRITTGSVSLWLQNAGAREIALECARAGDYIVGPMDNSPFPYVYTGVGSRFLSSTVQDGVFVERREVLDLIPAPTAWRFG